MDEPSDSKPTASNDGKDSDPVVDLVDGEIRLTLSMCNGMYRPEYIFPLVPIGIDAVAILEAKVRDLQEANREYQQRVFLKLGCDVDVTASNLFPWRAPVYMQRCPKQFELSSDSCSIVVRLEGLYELKVTVVGNGQYQRFFEALVNDERVAAVITGETNGHMSSHHLSCILMIRSGDTLTVKSGFSSTMCGDKSGDYNNLTLLRIGSFPEWA